MIPQTAARAVKEKGKNTMKLDRITEYLRGSVTLRIENRHENGFMRMLLSEKIPAKVYELTENGKKIGIGAVISPKFLKIIRMNILNL